MPLTRGKADGYDADLMAFKFTMKNGHQIVQCQISTAALSDLADRRRGSTGDLQVEFAANRELIEAIASALFDQSANGGHERGQHFLKTHSQQPFRQTTFDDAKA